MVAENIGGDCRVGLADGDGVVGGGCVIVDDSGASTGLADENRGGSWDYPVNVGCCGPSTDIAGRAMAGSDSGGGGGGCEIIGSPSSGVDGRPSGIGSRDRSRSIVADG